MTLESNQPDRWTSTLTRIDEVLDDTDSSDHCPSLFDGLRALRDNDPDGALAFFRRAARGAPSPLDSVAAIAIGECHRLSRRTASAIRIWRRLGHDTDSPTAIRTMAWLSLAALADDLEDDGLAHEAHDALESLAPSFPTLP